MLCCDLKTHCPSGHSQTINYHQTRHVKLVILQVIMMAGGRIFDVLLLFCFFVSTLLVRKYAFSSTTCTLYGSQFLDKSQVREVNIMLEETYIYSTLWNLNCERWYLSPHLGLRLSSRKSLILLLLLIAGDIETCPGPRSDVFLT